MKLLFISANRLRRVMPPMPLGLASVIAQLNESRHDIRVVDLMFSDSPEGDIESALSSFKPDLIAISIRNIDNQSSLHTEYFMPEARRLIEVCREKSDAGIVIGGPAFTVSPVAAFEYLEPDFGIAGEGEIAFRELVDRLERHAAWSDIAGLVWREGDKIKMNPREYIEDLDSLRIPRRELFDNQRYAGEGGFANIVLKQGCSFNCLYCDGPHAMGRHWRMKSPEKVADELEVMKKEIGVGVAFFTDAIFNFPVEHAQKVCREIIKRKLGVHWIATLHPAYTDRDLVELMKEAGCSAVSLGCDTCSEKMLKVLRKGFTKEQLRTAAELLEDLEINYILSLLIGGPGEDRQTVQETIEFLEQRTPFLVDFCVGIRLMPGTDLVKIAIEEGVVSADAPLLEPTFYISPAIKDWIRDYLTDLCSKHPNWTLAHTEP